MPEQAPPEYPPPRRPDVIDHKRPRRVLVARLRGWSGRPLSLAIGWALSCALVTAVTLTAVNRVGHEVAGSTPRVISPAGVSAQVSENSASAAAASASASAKASADAPSAASTGAPTAATNKPVPPRNSAPSSLPSSAQATQTKSAVAPPPSSPPPSSRPPSPSTSASGSSSDSPAPSDSGSGSASPTASGSPTAAAGKSVFVVPGGQIVIACSGDVVANESSSVNAGYTKTDVSTTQSVDVTFTKDNVSSEYVYKCRAGQAIGGIVERP